MKRAIWFIGPLWAIGISVYILFAPLVRRVSASERLPHGVARAQAITHPVRSSWYEDHGWSAARPLLLPVMLACLPLLMPNPRARRLVGAGSAALLAVFCGLTVFSIGVYYLPGAGAMLAALVAEAKKAPHLSGDRGGGQ